LNPAMTPSQWFWDFIRSYEKFRPTAYAATAAEKAKGIWTLGWGHTNGVKEGDTCTTAQALQWLHDNAATAVAAVNSLVTVPLTQAQFDALCSMAFNCGPGFLHTSTLAIMLAKLDYQGAADQMLRYDHQGTTIVPGLENRRIAERRHFLGLDSTYPPIKP
jgi:lysozyme